MSGTETAPSAMTGAAESARREAAVEMRRIAIAAGDAIMPYFRGEASPDAEAKADGSPVTAADHAADKVIVDGLRALYPDAPIVTEEQAETQAHDPGDFFFLVDPLDGTKEFISGSGEFTVNIALIEQGAPRIGVVYAPAMGRLFWTPDPDFAVEERIDENGEATLERQLWVADANNAALRVVASKSHRDPATDAYISRYRTASAQSAGSSLKFCLLACGEADLYPRLGPTMAWDTAAAHAVLRAAGGAVCALSADGQVGAPLRYGPGAMLPKDEDAPAPAPTGRSAYANPFFVAYAPSVELR